MAGAEFVLRHKTPAVEPTAGGPGPRTANYQIRAPAKRNAKRVRGQHR